MSKLGAALRAKFRSPQEVLRALGLDEKLVSGVVGDSKETDMKLASMLNSLKSKKLIAQDADMKDLGALLDALKSDPVEADAGKDGMTPDGGVPSSGELEDTSMDADPMIAAKALCGDRLSDEELAKLKEIFGGGMAPPAVDADCDAGMMPPKMGKDADPPMQPKKDGDKPNMVTQPAMDAAIALAVKTATKVQSDIRDAERFVRPFVGDLNIAFDSADSVYAKALELKGIDTKGVDPSAFKTILSLLPRAGERSRVDASHVAIASDSAGGASSKAFFDRYPDAKKIGFN